MDDFDQHQHRAPGCRGILVALGLTALLAIAVAALSLALEAR